jgi:hypothetical protein
MNRTTRTTNSVGVPVPMISAEKQLQRLVLASMLWEKQFYLDGTESAMLIKSLVPKVAPEKVALLAIQARHNYKLRHVPLLLVRELARIGKLKATVLNEVCQRPDEMGEFLYLYWSEGKSPLSNQVKKGLAQSFVKFSEYQLAKYDKNSAKVSIRDVMFLSHAKPVGLEQEALFKRVANKELVTPLTWETQLSSGADKAETFSRLMAEKKLGALAFLRNLRNMVQSGVSEGTIRAYALTLNVDKVLPFRYIAAARIVPQFEDMLEAMMLRSLSTAEKLSGKTVLMVDVSGSMFGTKISAKSDLDRFDAAAALAMLCVAVCKDFEVYTFSDKLVRVAPRKGFALADALKSSQQISGTRLGHAIKSLQANSKYDRLIVITDEESEDLVGSPKTDKGYILNVASYENGVNRNDWTTITGFSESVIDYIREVEKE